jgi:hypothetical protein
MQKSHCASFYYEAAALFGPVSRKKDMEALHA